LGPFTPHSEIETIATLEFYFTPSHADRRFQFQKRSQLPIRPHNETLSVVAVRINNPDRSPAGIDC
jgi:hypothetical protein